MATPKKRFKGQNEIQEAKEHFDSIRGSLLIHVYLYGCFIGTHFLKGNTSKDYTSTFVPYRKYIVQL
jgi:hypothetical protein